MVQSGDLVRHKTLSHSSKRGEYPLLGMVVSVHPNQGHPARELAKVMWLGCEVRQVQSTMWNMRIIPIDNLLLHINIRGDSNDL